MTGFSRDEMRFTSGLEVSRDGVLLRDLTVSLDGNKIFTRFSFFAMTGEVVGLVGRNGCGKSTLLNVLAGLLDPCASAEGHVCGIAFGEPDHCPCGLMLEQPPFIEHRSALFNMSFIGGLVGASSGDLIDLLEMVGLDPKSRASVSTYSLGMRKRLGFAQALIGSPPLLLLDEPMNGLDPEGTVMMRRAIRSAALNGTTVVMASHLLGELELACDRAYIIHDGGGAELSFDAMSPGSLEGSYLRALHEVANAR